MRAAGLSFLESQLESLDLLVPLVKLWTQHESIMISRDVPLKLSLKLADPRVKARDSRAKPNIQTGVVITVKFK